MINAILGNINSIFFAVWAVFFVIVATRFARPGWVKNISYGWLIVGAVVMHLLYVAIVTFGQYYVWAAGSDFTRALLSAPLPAEAPLPNVLEWTRAYFDQPLGYFAYYALGRFFLNIPILFFVAGLLYFVFKVWNVYRKGMGEYGPELLLVLMLIVGWPGVLLFIPLGLVLAIASFLLPMVSTRSPLSLEQSFLIATPLALFFALPLLAHLNLLTLLSV